MTSTELNEASLAILRVIADLEARREVPTVQAAAIGAGTTYMLAFDVVNQLFGEGLLNHALKVTDAGRKLIA
jgi:hypothetical protein